MFPSSRIPIVNICLLAGTISYVSVAMAETGSEYGGTDYVSSAAITVEETTTADATALHLTNLGGAGTFSYSHTIESAAKGDGEAFGVRADGSIGDVSGSADGLIGVTIYGVRKNSDRSVPAKFDFLGDQENAYALYAKGGIGALNAGTVITATAITDPAVIESSAFLYINRNSKTDAEIAINDDFYVNDPDYTGGVPYGNWIQYNVSSSIYGVYSGQGVGAINAQITSHVDIFKGDIYGGKNAYGVYAAGDILGIGADAKIDVMARGEGVVGGASTSDSSTLNARAYGVYTEGALGNIALGASIQVSSDSGEAFGVWANSVGDVAGSISLGVARDTDNNIYMDGTNGYGVRSTTTIGNVTGNITMNIYRGNAYALHALGDIGDFSGNIYFSAREANFMSASQANFYGIYSETKVGVVSGDILFKSIAGIVASDSKGSTGAFRGVTTQELGGFTGVINIERNQSHLESYGLKFDRLTEGGTLDGIIDVGATESTAYGIWYTGTEALGDVNTVMGGMSLTAAMLNESTSVDSSGRAVEIRFGGTEDGNGYGIYALAGVGDVNALYDGRHMGISVVQHSGNDVYIAGLIASAVFVGDTSSVGDINARLSAVSPGGAKSANSFYTLSAGRIGTINNTISATNAVAFIGEDTEVYAIHLKDASHTQDISITGDFRTITARLTANQGTSHSYDLGDFTAGVAAGIHTVGSLGSIKGDNAQISGTTEFGTAYGIYSAGNIASITNAYAISTYDVGAFSEAGNAFAVQTGTITGSISSRLFASLTKTSQFDETVDPHTSLAIALDLFSNQAHQLDILAAGSLTAQFAMEGFAIGLRAEGSIANIIGAGTINATGTHNSAYQSEVVGIQTGTLSGAISTAVNAQMTEGAGSTASVISDKAIGVELTDNSITAGHTLTGMNSAISAGYTGSGTAIGLYAAGAINTISGTGSISAESSDSGDFASSAIGVQTESVQGNVALDISASSAGANGTAKGLELTSTTEAHRVDVRSDITATATSSADAYALYVHNELELLTNSGHIAAYATSDDVLTGSRAVAVYVQAGLIKELALTGNLSSTAYLHADAYGILAEDGGRLGTIRGAAGVIVSSESGDAIGAAAGGMDAIFSQFTVSTVDGTATALSSQGNIDNVSNLISASASRAGDASAIVVEGNVVLSADGEARASSQSGEAIALHLTQTRTSANITNSGLVTASSGSGIATALKVDGVLDSVDGNYSSSTESGTAYAIHSAGNLGSVAGTYHLTGGTASATMYAVRSDASIVEYTGSINTNALIGGQNIYGISAAESIDRISSVVEVHNPLGNAIAVQAKQVNNIDASITATTSHATSNGIGLQLTPDATLASADMSFKDGIEISGYTINELGETTGLGYSIHAEGRDITFNSQTSTGYNPTTVNAQLKGDIYAERLDVETGFYQVDVNKIDVGHLVLGTRNDSLITNETRLLVGNSVGEIAELCSTNLDFHVSSFAEHSRLTVEAKSVLHFSAMERIDVYLGDTYFNGESQDVIITLVDGPLTGLTEDWLDANIFFTLSDGSVLNREELRENLVYVDYDPAEGLFLVPLHTIPEPSTALLGLLGLGGILARRRRKNS